MLVKLKSLPIISLLYKDISCCNEIIKTTESYQLTSNTCTQLITIGDKYRQHNVNLRSII